MDYLRIGDYITLKSLKYDGYMFADGILIENISIEESNKIQAFEETLFCIHYPRQYSAARELEEFNDEQSSETIQQLDPSIAKKYLTALMRGRDNENKLNDTYMTQKMGTPVLFGDLIQLLHVKSGKFVTVLPDRLASQERENMVVTLSESGSIYSWFKINPRYKIDKEGDKILSGTEVLLKVSERPNEYIHCSERLPLPGTSREINCSLETSSWKVSIFQSVKDGLDKNLILGTNLVYIHDPETRSNISVIQETDSMNVTRYSISISPTHSNGDSDSLSLWVIESKNLITGGPIQSKTDLIRFRHLNTGKYLIMKSDRSTQNSNNSKRSSPIPDNNTPNNNPNNNPNNKKINYELSLSDTPYISSSLFTLHEMYGTSLYLTNAKAVQLCCHNIFVERGDYRDELGMYYTSGTKDKSKAASLLIRKYAQTLKRNEVEIGEVINKSNEYVGLIEESLDVFVGVNANKYLTFYINQMIIPTYDFSNGTFWPKHPSSLFPEFLNILKKLLHFVKGLKISSNPTIQMLENTIVKRNFRIARQGLLLEQGVISILLHLLELLHPLAEKNELITIGSKQFLQKLDSEKTILRMSDALISQSLILLFNCIEDNPKTQIYVADSLPILLAYVASHEVAAKCVTEMLSTNMELQETKISEREINIFTTKLRSSKMNSMYLNLLKACCSCMGKPIDGNQAIVAEALFDDVSDIIIQIHQDLSKSTKVNWINNSDLSSSLFIPFNYEPGSPMLGQELVDRGYPQLSLSWTTKSIDYSPLGLFGKLSVNIQDLYPGKNINPADEWSLTSRRSTTKGSMAQIQKQAVADYFVAELYLAAEMCLGRNYVAMQKLETFFSYNTLVTIMKMNVMGTLKSAATRLILCLYVDREPQIITTVPCLTRSWSETIKSGTPQLPYVEMTRKNQFGLLQQLISEHIREMTGTRWEDLSVSMMLLLKHLIMFNFYGTKEKLRDVIEPLINAIDRRNVSIESLLQNSNNNDEQLSLSTTGRKKRKKMKRSNSTAQSNNNNNNNNGNNNKSKYITDGNGFDDSLKIEEGKEQSQTIGEVSDSRKEESEHPDIEISWQQKILTILESITFMCLIIILVFAAIIVAMYVTITGIESPEYRTFDIVVTAIFCCEVSLRFYCHSHVRKEIVSFFLNPLNDIDIAVCIIDLTILGIPGTSGSGTSFIKALRAVRLIRLIRLFRAARIMQKLKDLAIKPYEPWKMPIRYIKTPKHELETVVEAMNILSYIQHIVEDRYLSLLLQGFHEWYSGKDLRTPSEIFESVISDSKDLTLGCNKFNDVFIDTIMFSHVELVQVALDVLMAHHSARGVLFENARKMQLLTSSQRERQFKTIRNMLNELARNAETHELWGSLSNDDDKRINLQTFEHMSELIQMCRTRCIVLDFDEDYTPDVDIQNMLRNLGFFQVAMKILGLLPSINLNPLDDEIESNENTRNLIKTCNDLLYWFLNDNSSNQQLGFDELLFFLNSLDMGINSHHTIRAIFKDNEQLMRSCPRELIEEYSERVCKNGRRPQYLAILSSVTHVREKNILENQYEIVKHLMSPGRMKKMIRFCVDKLHPEYEERVELMKPFLKKGDVNVNDLPIELSYHIEILRVLAGCTVGRINITTVEAKVQSVYSYKGMLEALLDDRTLNIVKTRIGLLFFNAMVEVEILVSGLAVDPLIWQFISSTKDTFIEATEQLKSIEEHGWETSGSHRQFIEYSIVSAMILSGYFIKYFDLSNFETFAREDKPMITMEEVQNTMISVFSQLYIIYEMKCKCLTLVQKMYISQALDSMRRYSPIIASQYPEIDIIYPNTYLNKDLDIDDDDNDNDNDNDDDSDNNNDKDKDNDKEKGLELSLLQSEELPDVLITRKFNEFIKLLELDEGLKKSIETENQDFVNYITNLPFIADNANSDLRYETVTKKLVMHVRDRLETTPTEKRLDNRCTQTTIWIIRSFRTMIENAWGMTINERDEDGGEEEDIASAPIVQALNSCGATALCLDLISIGIDSSLMLECVRLCVAMLYREGGNLPVQQTIYNYLKNTKSDLFFKQIHKSFQTLILWHKWHDIIILKEDQEVELPEDIILVRFLQLLCEGHYQPNQDIMREQVTNSISINLLDDYVAYLNCLSRIPCRTSTEAAIKVSSTILEVIQGPCESNQEHFVLQTELIETLNRIIRAKTTRDCIEESEIELKKTGIDILQGLLEGQGGNNVIYDRVLSVVHLDAIQMMCYPEQLPTDNDEDEEIVESPEVVILRVECLVLLQMLCDYRPSLREELELDSKKSTQNNNINNKNNNVNNNSNNINNSNNNNKNNVGNNNGNSIGAGVASIEILWRGELQRRFFHVPAICADLAKASKDNLVEYVNRKNQESKLLDFLARSRELYREIKHQQLLKVYYVSGVFSRANQDRATWISLFLAVLINAILVIFFRLENGEPYLNNSVQLVVNGLNITQIVFSSFTLILFLVVRVPVKYQSNHAKGMDQIRTILHTCSDPMTLYYFFYLVCSIMGYNVSYFFLTILLLDILVKNATARDILMAVVYPRKQLALSYLLMLFVIYIFAFVVFFYFRYEIIPTTSFKTCKTLFACYKIALGNALRSDGGIGDFMTSDLGTRYIVDTLYFIVVMVILLNVIFGIVIDTFGNLRSEKADRQADTMGTCFICGIDKQVFDRASDGVQGFTVHIKTDHNMWNYLFFIIYLWEQDKDDDDGLEQYVRRSIDANDINWFPMGRAMRLNVEESEEDQLLNELKEDIEGAEEKMTNKLTSFQAEISSALEEINRNLSSAIESQEVQLGSSYDSPIKGDFMNQSSYQDDNSIGSNRKNSNINQKNKNDRNNKNDDESIESNNNNGGNGNGDGDDESLNGYNNNNNNNNNKFSKNQPFNGKYLEDEQSVDSASVITNPNNPNYYKKLQLRILDIQGLILPSYQENTNSMIFLRILTDTGIFSLNSLNVIENNKITFSDQVFLLNNKISIDNKNTLKIQILSGQSDKMAKFISIVEISYETLINATDLVYEKLFTQPDNPKMCILSLYPMASEIDITPMYDEDD